MTPVAEAAAGAAQGLVAGLGRILDGLFTSDEERAKAALALEQMRQLPALKQIEVNLKEAEHPSVFVAGWRPAAGWACVAAMIYAYIGEPLLRWAAAVWQFDAPPVLDTGDLMVVLTGLLGLGAYRMVEGRWGTKRTGWTKRSD